MRVCVRVWMRTSVRLVRALALGVCVCVCVRARVNVCVCAGRAPRCQGLILATTTYMWQGIRF